MSETLHDSPVNFMTESTKKRLQHELEEFEQRAEQAGQESGEAAGQGADWHDNPAYDEAVKNIHFYNSRAITHRAKLRNVEIIKPRQQTDVIGIGNEIVVKFSGEDDNETFTLLGESDADNDRGWISISSPLGQQLIGMKKGDTIQYEIDQRIIRVKIIDIRVGNFE